MEYKKIYKSDDEIDVVALIRPVWLQRKLILKTVFSFAILGLFVAVFSEKEYKSSTVFVTQTSEGKVGGSLGGLAAMAGINLGSMEGDSGINPIIYPKVLNSINFQKELMETKLSFSNGVEKVSYKHYYSKVHKGSLVSLLKKYTIGLPGVLIKKIKGKKVKNIGTPINSTLLKVSLQEFDLMKQLKEQVELDVNEDDGYITLSAKMPEALAAAELALKTQSLLQKYIIDFRIQKSKEQLKYIKERYWEVEKKFKECQLRMADFQDKNKFVTTAKSKIEWQSINDEYELIYGVFTELSKQLEAQYIKVTENTPVFTIIEPVSIPVEKSNTRKLFVLIGYSIFGFFVSFLIILFKIIFPKLKKTLNEIS